MAIVADKYPTPCTASFWTPDSNGHRLRENKVANSPHPPGSHGKSLTEADCGPTESTQSADGEWERPATTSAATQRHYTAVAEAVISAHKRVSFNSQNTPSPTPLALQRASETKGKVDTITGAASIAQPRSLAPTTERATVRSDVSMIQATASKSVIPAERREEGLDALAGSGGEVVGGTREDKGTMMSSALASSSTLGEAGLCGGQGRLEFEEESAEVRQTLKQTVASPHLL